MAGRAWDGREGAPGCQDSLATPPPLHPRLLGYPRIRGAPVSQPETTLPQNPWSSQKIPLWSLYRFTRPHSVWSFPPAAHPGFSEGKTISLAHYSHFGQKRERERERKKVVYLWRTCVCGPLTLVCALSRQRSVFSFWI